MKHFIAVLFALALFSSCEQSASVVSNDIEKPYYVKNSKWEEVDISTLSVFSSRSTESRSTEISFSEALVIATEYNAVTNDDQLTEPTETISTE